MESLSIADQSLRVAGGPFFFLNGKLLPIAAASISPLDRAFMYADGVYTTVRVSRGRSLHLPRHLARLQRDSAALMFGIDVYSLGLDGGIPALIAENEVLEGFVRVEISRGTFLNISDLTAMDPLCLAMAKSTSVTPAALKVVTAPDTRDAFASSKTTNRLPALLALHAALKRGAQEALFVRNGSVVEGSCHNVFQLRDGVLFTPDVTGRGLPGIIREILLEAGECQIGEFHVNASAPAYLSNCLVGAVPILSIDDVPLPQCEQTRQRIVDAIKRADQLP